MTASSNRSQRLANGASHAVGFFILLGFGLASPVLPLLADDLGLTAATIGVAVGAFAIGRLLFGIGTLVGLNQARHMLHPAWLIGGCALTAAAAVWCGLAPDGAQLVVARVVQGVGSAMAMLAASIRPFVSDDEERLGRRVGDQQTIFLLGTAVGPVVGGAMGQFLGLHTPFWITAALALLAIPCGLVAHRFGPRVADIAPITVASSQTRRRTEQRPRRRGSSMSAAVVAALAIIAVANGSRSGFRTTFFPIWAHDVLGLTETLIGVALGIGALGFLVSAVAGPLADRVGAVPLLVAGGIVLASSTALILLFSSVPSGFASMVLSTVGASTAIVAASTVVLSAGDASRRLIAIRNQRVATDIGMFLGPVLVGLSISLWDYPGTLVALTVVSLAVVAAAAVARPRAAAHVSEGTQ